MWGGLQRPGLYLGLELGHVTEDTVLLQQLRGRAALYHRTVSQYHHLVCTGHGTHTVGDHQHGLVGDQAGQRSLNLAFVLHIQRSGGFVQQYNGRVLYERPGYGDPLPLTAEQLRDPVRGGRLHSGAVCHNGAGQIGQVLFAKVGQGQLFRQSDPAHAAFFISGKKAGVVLEECADTQQHQTAHAARNVQADLALCYAAARLSSGETKDFLPDLPLHLGVKYGIKYIRT